MVPFYQKKTGIPNSPFKESTMLLMTFSFACLLLGVGVSKLSRYLEASHFERSILFLLTLLTVMKIAEFLESLGLFQ
jgi:hypothetical protein